MSKKLTKEELKKKVKFHEKKVVYYEKKVEAIDKENHRIGFKHYD
jgi:hypothetical protein